MNIKILEKLSSEMSKRLILLLLGHFFVFIGIIGVFLPLLPTTPFLILAAACYSRSSQKFETWLYHHPRLGPPLRAWRDEGIISLKAKFLAVTCILLSGGATWIFTEVPQFGKWGMTLCLAGAIFFITTRPSKT